jgi:hypothetical protein
MTDYVIDLSICNRSSDANCRVVPGSGIDTPSMSVTLSDINVHSGLVKADACNDSAYDKKDIQSNVQTFQTNISATKTPNGRDISTNSDASAIAIGQRLICDCILCRDEQSKTAGCVLRLRIIACFR